MKFLIILLLLFPCSFFSQSNILKGKLVDSSTNQPIPFVNIINKADLSGTASLPDGSFELQFDSTSNPSFQFSHIAFITKTYNYSEISDKGFIIKLEPRLISSQSILVQGSLAKEGISPMSYSKIKRDEIASSYSVQDIPEILGTLPSVHFYSESGNGVGYNYMSIRGFDQRRISVSINGIPQNDPEDHNVYWIDFPDLLGSTEIIQVQRGAGNGLIGYPAIGGSVNIITSSFSDKAKIELSSSYGSYNTRKYSASVSSGLIDQKYSVYAKLSKIMSSGYRDLSWSNLNSYHLSAVRFDENVTSQINIYGGIISDGLAYTGLPKFAINDKKLRRENYSYWSADNGEYTYTSIRRPEEIENFNQPHFEILNDWVINENLKFNSALFLVLGEGFFDYDGSWADTSYYRITNINGFGPIGNPGNSLIRAKVENKQWGWIPRVNITHKNGELIIGGEIREHNSIHWGSINFAENLPSGFPKDFRYYYYEGQKSIINFFVNENYFISEKVNLLAELQFSYNRYKLHNEKYLGNEFKVNHSFLNSRIGINYQYYPGLNFYIMFANTSREPRLKNYYDAAESSGGAVPQFQLTDNGKYNFNEPLVHPETMYNFEMGSSYRTKNIDFSINLYLMLFNNEIVKNGQLDRFGQPITGNMKKTIHYGLESSANFKLMNNFNFLVNASLSKDYIKEGLVYIDYYNPLTNTSEALQLNLNGNTIAGFPEANINGIIQYNYKGLNLQIINKYVSGILTDNFGENILNKYPGIVDYPDNKVDPYFVTNLFIGYTFDLSPFLKEVKAYLQINNLFDNLYAAYGIGSEFFPAAERNILGGVSINL
ncbi:MAG: TonB-dependent receptor [Melioribacteraceae bacterium]|nr:TonB-dependent receptor [Melioribacteraceae bacterium]